MTELTLTTYNNRQIESALSFLGFFLPITAVVITCLVSYFSTSMIAIKNPLILVFASICTLIPFKSENLITLQKITGFYSFAVLVNLISGCYFTLSSLSIDASASWSIIPLFLCTVGFLLNKLNANSTRSIDKRHNILTVWSIAFAVIILHMTFLALLVHKFYGYGYGHNPNTMGNLVLYLLLFVVLWDRLGGVRFRQGTGIILMVFYLIPILTNK